MNKNDKLLALADEMDKTILPTSTYALGNQHIRWAKRLRELAAQESGSQDANTDGFTAPLSGQHCTRDAIAGNSGPAKAEPVGVTDAEQAADLTWLLRNLANTAFKSLQPVLAENARSILCNAADLLDRLQSQPVKAEPVGVTDKWLNLLKAAKHVSYWLEEDYSEECSILISILDEAIAAAQTPQEDAK